MMGIVPAPLRPPPWDPRATGEVEDEEEEEDLEEETETAAAAAAAPTSGKESGRVFVELYKRGKRAGTKNGRGGGSKEGKKKSKHDLVWEDRHSELLTFRSKHGHSNVPYNYGDRRLALWVTHQRRLRKSGRMREDRLRAL